MSNLAKELADKLNCVKNKDLCKLDNTCCIAFKITSVDSNQNDNQKKALASAKAAGYPQAAGEVGTTGLCGLKSTLISKDTANPLYGVKYQSVCVSAATYIAGAVTAVASALVINQF